MNKKWTFINNLFIISIAVIHLHTIVLHAQEVKIIKPFSLDSYKYELSHPTYTELLLKLSRGDTLSFDEKAWLQLYSDFLKNSFQFLPEVERNRFQSQSIIKQEQTDSLAFNYTKELIEKESQKISFDAAYIRHIIESGGFGVYYGIAIDQIFEFEDMVAVGVPFLVAGANMLNPIVNNKKFSNISNNALWLRSHGKTVGTFGGLALSALLFGNDFLDKYEDYDYDDWENRKVRTQFKATHAITALSSIGLGMYGFKLGRTKDWTEGRTALYRHFCYMNTLIGMGIILSTDSDNARVYGASALISSASGYYIADRIANKYEYTRGDMITTAGYSILHTSLAMGFLLDISNRSDIEHPERLVYLPIAGAIYGTQRSLKELKNVRLTLQQGRRTNLAMAGGSLIGLGFAILIDWDEITPYYLFPYATGLLSYSLLMKHYKASNLAGINKRYKGKGKVDYTFNFMPQNILLNNMMVKKQTGINAFGGNLPILNFAMEF